MKLIAAEGMSDRKTELVTSNNIASSPVTCSKGKYLVGGTAVHSIQHISLLLGTSLCRLRECGNL